MNLLRSLRLALVLAVAVELVPFLLLLSSDGGPCGPVDARSGFAVLWHLPSLIVVSFFGLGGTLGGGVVALLQVALLALVGMPFALLCEHRSSGPEGCRRDRSPRSWADGALPLRMRAHGADFENSALTDDCVG